MCCQTLQKAFKYADAHVSSRATCFCSLFGLLVQKTGPEKGTYDEDIIITSMLSSKLYEQNSVMQVKDDTQLQQNGALKDKNTYIPAE